MSAFEKWWQEQPDYVRAKNSAFLPRQAWEAAYRAGAEAQREKAAQLMDENGEPERAEQIRTAEIA